MGGLKFAPLHQAVDQGVGHDVELAHLVVNVRLISPVRPAVLGVGLER
jgi:hypothetical protein